MLPPASLFLSSLLLSSSPITAVPSVAWTFCCSAGALGLAVTCGCSLSPKIYGMSSCCKALLVLRALNLSSLLGGVELACMSSEARGLEQMGVRDVVVGTSSPVWNHTGRRQLRRGQ